MSTSTSVGNGGERSFHEPIHQALIREGLQGISVSPLITVQNVSRVFTSGAKTIYALERVSFEIQAGDFVSLVGPSGCGKSTLLKIVSGLLPASSGSIAVSDKAVDAPLENVGMVFQSPVLLKWRPVLGNILLPVEFAKLDVSRKMDRAR
jgi:NitT/TauT family transport system ATP-binding protein